RKFSDVDLVCKRRRVGLGVDGIDSIDAAVDVVRVPLPPMAWAYIRARPWPKGQAPTLAARRRSPHLPGGGIRPVRQLSPGYRATLCTLRYSGAVVGVRPTDQGAIRSDHMLDVIVADGKASSGTSSKYPHGQGIDLMYVTLARDILRDTQVEGLNAELDTLAGLSNNEIIQRHRQTYTPNILVVQVI
ncbi:hypothetical protein H4S04_002835, partial [Coemansia sp. S16]